LIGIGLVDAVPARRVAWDRATRRFRRLGQMSLTIYAWNDVFSRLVYIPIRSLTLAYNLTLIGTGHDSIGADWMPGLSDEKPPKLSRVRQSFAEDACLLLYLLATPLAWATLLALWSRCGYVASFEWWIGKLVGSSKATRHPGHAAAGTAPVAVSAAAAASTASAPTGICTSTAAILAEDAPLPSEDAEGATLAWVCLLTMTWVPAGAWSVLSSTYLAPSLDDYYYQLNASHFFVTPIGITASGHVEAKADEDGWRWLVHSASPAMKLSISAQLFLLTYAIPVAACLLRLAVLRRTRSQQQHGSMKPKQA